MGNRFYCPQCKAHLNPGTKIIMRFGVRGKTGLILFSPTVGDYASILPEGVEFRDGERVDFFCPVCQAGFASASDARLGEVLLSRDDDDMVRIGFSRVYGEKATFVISSDAVQSYGPNAGDFASVNFFGAGQMEA